MKVILASSSPRRKEIFKTITPIKFSTYSPEIDESALPNEYPEDYCLRMSVEKNLRAISNFNNNCKVILITADTIVAHNEKILSKPTDYNNALDTLLFLSGKEHRVLTSITISHYENHTPLYFQSGLETTKVLFKDFSTSTAEQYLSITDYMDKAGSYAIQENGNLIVDSFHGSFSNIVGFPSRLFFNLIHDENIFREIYNY